MLDSAVDEYLVLRRAIGFKCIELEKQLRSYVRFTTLSEFSTDYVCATAAIEWAKLGLGPRSRYMRIRAIALFSDHLRLEDKRHELVPSHIIPAAHSRRHPPRIFSQQEIVDLLDLTDSLTPVNSIRPLLYRTLFGLLFVTGMRISEALQLRFVDIQSDALLVHKTKFGKSRQLPLHSSTSAELEIYLDVRRQLLSENDHLFLSSYSDQPLKAASVRRTFQILCERLHITGAGGLRRPRLHDLRHSFATNALVRCEAESEGVNQHTLALSTYMGHASIKSTYWYLEKTPELLRNVAEACEKYCTGEKP